MPALGPKILRFLAKILVVPAMAYGLFLFFMLAESDSSGEILIATAGAAGVVAFWLGHVLPGRWALFGALWPAPVLMALDPFGFLDIHAPYASAQGLTGLPGRQAFAAVMAGAALAAWAPAAVNRWYKKRHGRWLVDIEGES